MDLRPDKRFDHDNRGPGGYASSEVSRIAVGCGLRGKRGVTPGTAWLLAQALNTTPEYWVNLQTAHDLARSRPVTPVEPLKVAG